MKQSWTTVNKVLLIISMIACFIIVIFFAVAAAKSHQYDRAWVIFFCGVPSVIVSHALWGLFIEISTNIAQLLLPYKINNDTENTENTESIENNENIKIHWTCPKCGRSNYITYDFCQSCGKARFSETTEGTENSTDSEVQSLKKV